MSARITLVATVILAAVACCVDLGGAVLEKPRLAASLALDETRRAARRARVHALPRRVMAHLLHTGDVHATSK